jgi:hypothetical protein
MRLARALFALLLLGCPPDDHGVANDLADAPLSTGGRPDAARSGGTGQFCVYTETAFYVCVGLDPWPETHQRCFELQRGDRM